MKITAIKQQEKRKDRYSIFVDDKYAFSLSETGLLEQKLANGQELDKARLKEFKQLSLDDKVYNNTLRYAAMRLRSEWELKDYLRRKAVEEPVAETILNKLSDIGLMNDEAFARAWVENRRLLKPTSKRRLIQELKQKRVSEDVITSVLQGDDTSERSVLQELINKKRKQAKYAQDELKLMQYLARQGFNYDDIKAALHSEIQDD